MSLPRNTEPGRFSATDKMPMSSVAERLLRRSLRRGELRWPESRPLLPAIPAIELAFLDGFTLHVESQNHDPIDEGDLAWGASRVTWSADTARIAARALMWRAVPHWAGPRDRYTAVGNGADEDYYDFEADLQGESRSNLRVGRLFANDTPIRIKTA